MQLANIFHFFLSELKMKAFFTLSDGTLKDSCSGHNLGAGWGLSWSPGARRWSRSPAPPRRWPWSGAERWGCCGAIQALAAGLASASPALSAAYPNPSQGLVLSSLPLRSGAGISVRVRPQQAAAGPRWMAHPAGRLQSRCS